MYTVGELSRLTGITVRALHHYDEIGLCSPSARSAAGYRLYDDDDVFRLQQVLLFRELGLPLAQIATAIDQAASREDLLRHHRQTLIQKRERLDAMVAAIDAALKTIKGGAQMRADDVKSMFGGFDPSLYEEEAKKRWGDTDAYKESMRRTKKYGKPEWEAIQREVGEIYRRFVEQMRAGASPADPAVQAVVAEHRAHLDRWFYSCSKELHKGLGEMYVADPRFTENIDKFAPGLAQFMRDAIAAS
jgi:DNA-binding transcriptional MerR regulator